MTPISSGFGPTPTNGQTPVALLSIGQIVGLTPGGQTRAQASVTIVNLSQGANAYWTVAPDGVVPDPNDETIWCIIANGWNDEPNFFVPANHTVWILADPNGSADATALYARAM